MCDDKSVIKEDREPGWRGSEHVIVTCDCGQKIKRYADENGEYYHNTVCPRCDRTSSGGNYRTGMLSAGWMSRSAVDSSQREYERQMFDSDMNQMYGRGNW